MIVASAIALLIETCRRIVKEMRGRSTPVPTTPSCPCRAKIRRRTRMWVYVDDEAQPYNVFDFTMDRGRDGPKRFERLQSGTSC